MRDWKGLILALKGSDSMERLARSIGCSAMAVSRWLSGEAIPTGLYRDKVEELAKAKGLWEE